MKRRLRLNCLSATVITALLMAISVFLGNVSHTEYKSQMRKRKMKKTEQAIVDGTILDDTTTTPESETPESEDIGSNDV